MNTDEQPVSNLVPFDKWLRDLDVTRTTGWEYRRRGWIKAIEIAGRNYVTREQIAEFERRAAAGEFAKKAK